MKVRFLAVTTLLTICTAIPAQAQNRVIWRGANGRVEIATPCAWTSNTSFT